MSSYIPFHSYLVIIAFTPANLLTILIILTMQSCWWDSDYFTRNLIFPLLQNIIKHHSITNKFCNFAFNIHHFWKPYRITGLFFVIELLLWRRAIQSVMVMNTIHKMKRWCCVIVNKINFDDRQFMSYVNFIQSTSFAKIQFYIVRRPEETSFLVLWICRKQNLVSFSICPQWKLINTLGSKIWSHQ